MLEKLERDYARLEVADPASFDAQYAAFDFFVGANHLADWLKHSQGGSLSQHRAYQDGALVEHIANGAKHFRVDHHRTAKDTRVVDGVWAAKVWKLGVWARGVWREACLLIDLEDGTSVDVQVVAKRVAALEKNGPLNARFSAAALTDAIIRSKYRSLLVPAVTDCEVLDG